MDNDLRKIKNKFGEDMAKLCRRLFPTLLEEEGIADVNSILMQYIMILLVKEQKIILRILFII